MNELKKFLLENLQFIAIILFLVLPVILNIMRSKRKRPPQKSRPQRLEPTGAERPGAEDALEDKVRRFFEDIVVTETKPKPRSTTPVAEPQEQIFPGARSEEASEFMSLEDRMEGDVPRASLQAEVPAQAVQPIPPPVPPAQVLPPEVDRPEEFPHMQPEEITPQAAGYDVRNLDLRDLVAAGVHIGSFHKLTRSELRRAIILKEILDKPVSLRN